MQAVAAPLDAAASDEFAGAGLSGGDGENSPHGVGVGRIPVEFEPLADRSGRHDPRSCRERIRIGRVDDCCKLFEELVICAQQIGGAVEEHGHVSLGDSVEQWEQLVTDPVATKPRIVVRGIIGDGQAELLAQRMGLGPSQGQDGVTPSWPDRAEASGTGSSQQCQQERLGLVISGVTGQRVMPECCSTSSSGSCFEIRTIRDIDSDRPEWHVEVRCHGASDVGVGIGRCPQPVVDVDGGDLASGLDGQGDHGRRVGAAGQTTGDGSISRRKRAPSEKIGGVEQRQSALVGDRYRSVWWAERCPRRGCCLALTAFR